MNQSLRFMIFLVVCSGSFTRLYALDQKTIAARTDHLRQMSEIERGRFDRNLQEFQKLSEAEKQRYRQLHEGLIKDNSHGGGLSKLLQTYSVWIQTLTPTQRDELQKETTSSQKLALIRRFKDEQDEPSESHEQTPQTDAHPDDVSHQVSTPIKREAFPLKDLRSVIAVLVNRLPSELKKSEFSDPHLSDFIPIIQTSVQAAGGSYREWPDEAQLKEMTTALGKESMSLVNRPDYKTRRDAMVRYLLMGIMKHARDSVRTPSEAEKMQILVGLTQGERDRIWNLPADKMNGFLVKRSVEEKGGDALDAYKKLPEYSRQIEDLFQRFEVPTPARFLLRTKKGPLESRGDGKRPPLNRPNRTPGEK
jgi:hypothetical protein